MGDFKKGGFGGGKRPHGFRPGGNRPPFARKGGFGGGDRSDRGDARPQLFGAKCANCNDSCEVPFRPSGDRPVFCKNCFAGDRSTQKREFARHEAPRSFESRRPEFAPDRKPQPAVVDNRIEEVKKQLDALHKKVDSLVRMMETSIAAPAAQPIAKIEANKVEKKEVEKKPVTKKKVVVAKLAKKAAPKKASSKKIAKK